jgi:prepilin-type N-terminal cleavage/methylation domain-containing protein
MTLRMRPARGFTLIELILAIGIAALLVGISIGAMSKDRSRTEVYAAANELAAVLRRTRAMAMERQAMYAVTFNIQNEPGSSGRVLNNRSGGHGYRIIGPDWHARTSDGRTLGAIPFPEERMDAELCRTFPHLLTSIRSSWVGEMHLLPAKKVRFLALSDTDEGPRRRSGWVPWDASMVWYTATYPRPYFGYFDASTKTLWPWGGYAHDVTGSGFFYEGDDGEVNGCRHQKDRAYDVDLNEDKSIADTDIDGDGTKTGPYEQEKDIVIWRKDEPRPLVNADWLDATIAFRPDGSAQMLSWMLPRRYYNNVQETTTDNDRERRWVAGVRDMTRNDHGTKDKNGRNLVDDGRDTHDTGEAVHFNRHTGGWFITLAPDSPDDRYQFSSAKEAMDSLLPMVRIFVAKNGSVRILTVKALPSLALASGQTVWPPSPTDWQQTGQDSIAWKDCRFGWLHASNVPDMSTTGTNNSTPDGRPDDNVPETSLSVEEVDTAGTTASAYIKAPRGHPITDMITPSMLTDRVWWITP